MNWTELILFPNTIHLFFNYFTIIKQNINKNISIFSASKQRHSAKNTLSDKW